MIVSRQQLEELEAELLALRTLLAAAVTDHGYEDCLILSEKTVALLSTPKARIEVIHDKPHRHFIIRSFPE